MGAGPLAWLGTGVPATTAAIDSPNTVAIPTSASVTIPRATTRPVRSRARSLRVFGPVRGAEGPAVLGWRTAFIAVASIPCDNAAMEKLPTKRRVRRALVLGGLTCGLVLGLGAAHPARAAAAKPKFHFHVVEIKAPEAVGAERKTMARELLEKEMASRAEFTSERGGAGSKSFDVSMTIDSLDEKLDPPRPGGRLKQLTVSVKVSVFGTTVEERKLAFSGEGEAGIQGEIVERKRAEEATTMTQDAMTQAVKQAVDQCVAKLGRAASQPMDESKRRRRKN